jgi:hypothetical protein
VEHGSETFPSRAPLPTIALARTSNSKLAEDASAQRRERPKRKITSQRLTPRAITAQNAVSGEFRSGDVNDGLSLVQGRRFAQDPSGPRHFTERVFPVKLDELQFPHHPVEALTNCVRPISVKRVVSLWMIGEFVATRVQFDSERYGFLRFEVRKTERGDTSGPLPQG